MKKHLNKRSRPPAGKHATDWAVLDTFCCSQIKFLRCQLWPKGWKQASTLTVTSHTTSPPLGAHTALTEQTQSAGNERT